MKTKNVWIILYGAMCLTLFFYILNVFTGKNLTEGNEFMSWFLYFTAYLFGLAGFFLSMYGITKSIVEAIKEKQ